eukprot:340204_1
MCNVFSYLIASIFIILVIKSNAFNYSKCPGPLEVQTADVMNNFDINMYTGIYYEVAYHDLNQSDPSCVQHCATSNKTLNTLIPAIEDHFNMFCEINNNQTIRYYNDTFEYNLTNISAYFVGYVHSNDKFNGHIFPDTVVATGDIVTNAFNKKQYEFVIEFQCKTETILGEEFVDFVGVNFYSETNHPTESMMDNMINIAYQQGLGLYLNKSLVLIDQNNCTYPWNITSHINL